jgi:hypothetical protein
VNNTAGSIGTEGDVAAGIFAQSVGGGGGAGGLGSASAAGGQNPAQKNFAASIAIGGNGGSSGNGGTVTVTNGSAITTAGTNSAGVFAQSVGGGGGVAIGLGGSAQSTAGGGTFNLGFSLGGSGGGGGTGGTVGVTNTGSIQTVGDQSFGVFAQSVGGGGGNGGAGSGSAQSSTSSESSTTVSASLGIGGGGGTSGAGGSVNVTNGGSIATAGFQAGGIFAQSIGGSGGTGGAGSGASNNSSDKINIGGGAGGSGGNAGTGGTVTIGNTGGSIKTTGDEANAIFAQSVGGGGGAGGLGSANVSSSSSGNQESFSATIGIGGSGGSSGNGGAVNVANASSIVTAGNSASGIIAQSVGGGGGDAVALGGNAQSNASGGTYNLGFTLGGSGGSSGDGAAVNVTNTGSIQTLGNDSYGVFAQSVGGGGGAGGGGESTAQGQNSVVLGIGGGSGAGGAGGSVVVSNSGSVDTSGHAAHGIFAQSVGGGGGIGGGGAASTGGNVSVGGGIGGSGGSAGSGGSVSVTNNGSVTTRGSDAFGILAQSVGGGGGDGGAGNGGATGTNNVGVSVGGSAGSTGNGGTVGVMQNGNVTTLGDRSYGVFAQSVGGGGGMGGAAGSDTGLIAVGLPGGGGGNGGNVNVTVSGNVSTTGQGAYGVFAQSVGGGGGVGGSVSGRPLSLGVALGGGPAGNGGNITVTTSGTITTKGQAAYGIFAQSVGGSGGTGGSATNGLAIVGSNGGTGTSGSITVNHTGSIVASGPDSFGIFAQSVGPSGAGNIAVTVSGGTIQGGSGSGAGIVLDGGSANSVTVMNNGTVKALSGVAVHSSNGSNLTDNFGTVIGNVTLGTGSSIASGDQRSLLRGAQASAPVNRFLNETSGTFASGTIVNLSGAPSVLQNNGVLTPGGQFVAVTTALNGNFVQSSTGTYAADLDLGGRPSDLVNATGSATIAGSVSPTLLFLQPKQQPVTILNAAGGLTNGGAVAGGSIAIDYGLTFTPTSMALAVTGVHFAVPGLTDDQASVGQHFNDIWNSGSVGGLGFVMAYFGNFRGSVAPYGAAMNRITPEPYIASLTANASSSMGFADSLMSCRAYSEADFSLGETNCKWGRFTTGSSSLAASSSTIGYNQSYNRLAAGAQVEIAPHTFFGYGAQYENTATQSADISGATGNNVAAGAVLKRENGPWLFGAELNAGYNSSTTTRYVNIPTTGVTPQAVTAQSGSSVISAGTRFRAAYTADLNPWYVKPFVDIDLMYFGMPPFSETGAGPLNLNVMGMGKVLAAGSPTLEFAKSIRRSDGSIIRPFAQAGATFFSSNTWSVTSEWAGTPAGVSPFTVTSKLPSILGKIAAGVELQLAKRLNAKFEFDRQFGQGFLDNEAWLKASMRF